MSDASKDDARYAQQTYMYVWQTAESEGAYDPVCFKLEFMSLLKY